MACRKASHAGSWYKGEGKELSAQLSGWIGKVDVKVSGSVRAIICPHAGYSYSGPTAAYSFAQINPKTTKRIFILGPSHHYHTKSCEMSDFSIYETPVGNLDLDVKVIADLKKSGLFLKTMNSKIDHDEHSIEMQLPYIAHVMKGCDFTIVPILVGALTAKREKDFGALLAPYLLDADNVFVISSDFCHWGERFGFTHHDKKHDSIWQSIEALDRLGMDLIEKQDAEGFSEYLDATNNTICGCHPISVFLHAVQASKAIIKDGSAFKISFLSYSQSSKCKKSTDSSVSYVSGVCVALHGKQ